MQSKPVLWERDKFEQEEQRRRTASGSCAPGLATFDRRTVHEEKMIALALAGAISDAAAADRHSGRRRDRRRHRRADWQRRDASAVPVRAMGFRQIR
jgi:hypothetical protein